MGRPAARPVAVCTLLVLAGCSGFAPPAEPTRTLTPAAVPTPPPTPSPTPTPTPGPPSGLTARGVVDPLELANAHQVALLGTSYTVRRRHVERYANGSLRMRSNATTQVGTTPDHYYFAYRVDEPARTLRGENGTRVETWSNGKVVLTLAAFDNTTSYSRREPTAIRRYYADELYIALSSLNTTVERTTRDGATVYRIRATTTRPPTTVESLTYGRPRVRTVENVSFHALVAPTGLVRLYHLEYTAHAEEGTIRVTETARFTRVGTTNVTRPAWVDTALDETDA